jgi:hypothetical protein
LEGNGRGLIHVLSRHLLEGTERNYEKPQSGQSVTRLRFSRSTNQGQSSSMFECCLSSPPHDGYGRSVVTGCISVGIFVINQGDIY